LVVEGGVDVAVEGLGGEHQHVHCSWLEAALGLRTRCHVAAVAHPFLIFIAQRLINRRHRLTLQIGCYPQSALNSRHLPEL
jgi:hypothetical protein